MRPKLIAITAAALFLFASVAPAVATEGDLSVAANQDAGGVTVTVTHDGAAVENASVDVNATDGNYSGEGTYATDENGTVDLPAPGENVTVDITAEYENQTATTTAELVVAGHDGDEEADSFGARVSAFVRSLLDGTGEQQRGIGRAVADWVVANNPGNAPDHAGPPEGDDHGKPAFAGDDGVDAGENEIRGNVTASGAPDDPGESDEREDGHGPPENPGSNRGDAARGHGR